MKRTRTLILALAVLAVGCKNDASEKQPPPPAKKAAEAKPKSDDDYAMELVAGTKGCFKKFEVNGQVDGKLTMVVAGDGHVASASYAGSAPEPIRQCMVDLIRSKKLPDYAGAPGLATYTYNGSYSNGVEMMSESWSFERRPELPPEKQAMVDEALGGTKEAPQTGEPPKDEAAGEAPADAPAAETPTPGGAAPAPSP